MRCLPPKPDKICPAGINPPNPTESAWAGDLLANGEREKARGERVSVWMHRDRGNEFCRGVFGFVLVRILGSWKNRGKIVHAPQKFLNSHKVLKSCVRIFHFNYFKNFGTNINLITLNSIPE